MRNNKPQIITMAILLVVSIIISIDFYSKSPHLSALATSTVVPIVKSDPIVFDGNATKDHQDGSSHFFWLLGRETNFVFNTQAQKAPNQIEVFAGADPCGRQSLFELSFVGSAPIELGGLQKSVIVQLVTPNIHVRSLSSVCLIASDPRNFFGNLRINLNTKLAPFDFSLK